MTPHRLIRRQAFTLIEILMAMAIFALVMSAIYSTWMLIAKGSRAGAIAAAEAQRERVAIHTIEEALTCVRSYQADIQHYGFIGENGSDPLLSFVAKLPKSFPRSGRFGDFDVRRVAFSLQNGPDSSRELVVRQCPILMDFDQDEMDHPLVLAKNVKAAMFEFWDPRLNDWTDAWGGAQTNQIPIEIRVTLELAKPNSTAKSEVVSTIVSPPSVMVPANWQRPNPVGGGQPPP